MEQFKKNVISVIVLPTLPSPSSDVLLKVPIPYRLVPAYINRHILRPHEIANKTTGSAAVLTHSFLLSFFGKNHLAILVKEAESCQLGSFYDLVVVIIFRSERPTS